MFEADPNFFLTFEGDFVDLQEDRDWADRLD